VEPALPALIDAAARPFGEDMEMRLATRQLLEDEENGSHSATADTLARWEKADRAKRPGMVIKVCLVACLVIAAILCGYYGAQFVRMMISYRALAGIGMEWLAPKQEIISALPDEKRYLYGDSRYSAEENARRLWQTDPKNPAYFARYTTAMEGERLPDAFLETARRIDPQNAWFLYQAAVKPAQNCVIRTSEITKDYTGPPDAWSIRDEIKTNEALALFQEAAKLPKYDSYESKLLSERIRLIPCRTLEEQLLATANIAGESASVGRLVKLTNIISAKASHFEEFGKEEELIDLMADSEAFVRQISNSAEGSLIHELVLLRIATTLSQQFKTSADKLGIGTEGDVWRKWYEATQSRKLAKDRGFQHPDQPDLTRHGGVLASLVLPMLDRQVQYMPKFSIEDHAPNRNAERAVFSRGLFISGCVLAGLLMLAILISKVRHPRLIRRLSGRMEQLLDRGDWAWILGLGVFVPICGFTAIQFLTSLGGRDYGLRYAYFWPHAYPTLAMLLACVALVIMIADWRVRKRMAAFRPLRHVAWFGWMFIALLGIGYGFVHVFLMSSYFIREKTEWLRNNLPFADELLFPNNTAMMVLVSAFLLLAILSLFRNGKTTLVQATVSRTLFPALSLAILLMSLTLPLFAAWEVRSLEHDRLVKPDPEFPSMTPYEYKVAVQLRKEIRETLGLNPTP